MRDCCNFVWALKIMVDTKLKDGASAALWTCRLFLYTVVLGKKMLVKRCTVCDLFV